MYIFKRSKFTRIFLFGFPLIGILYAIWLNNTLEKLNPPIVLLRYDYNISDYLYLFILGMFFILIYLGSLFIISKQSIIIGDNSITLKTIINKRKTVYFDQIKQINILKKKLFINKNNDIKLIIINDNKQSMMIGDFEQKNKIKEILKERIDEDKIIED